ncbi:hypothetical protein D9M72_632590 [compost metagenome]
MKLRVVVFPLSQRNEFIRQFLEGSRQFGPRCNDDRLVRTAGLLQNFDGAQLRLSAPIIEIGEMKLHLMPEVVPSVRRKHESRKRRFCNGAAARAN